MIELLANFKPIFIILHSLSAAIGVGNVFVLDALFFKFLKDFKISHKEKDTLNTISKIFWLSLLILIITGLAIFLPHGSDYLQKPKFMVKMIVVFIIFINGLFLNLFIAPQLEKVSFYLLSEHKANEFHKYSKIAFISGSISFVSWLTAFILGSIRNINLSFIEILSIYFLFLISAIIISLILEKFFELRYKKSINK